VLATEWPEFRELDFATLIRAMQQPLLIDQNSFVAKQVYGFSNLTYVVAGKVQ